MHLDLILFLENRLGWGEDNVTKKTVIRKVLIKKGCAA